jgi:hypothetical protein
MSIMWWLLGAGMAGGLGILAAHLSSYAKLLFLAGRTTRDPWLLWIGRVGFAGFAGCVAGGSASFNDLHLFDKLPPGWLHDYDAVARTDGLLILVGLLAVVVLVRTRNSGDRALGYYGYYGQSPIDWL